MEESCNQTIYCYLEEQKDALKTFLTQHNNDSIIHLFLSVTESCEKNLFYCLGDIINNCIEETDDKIWFATDIKSLYDIVQKLYAPLFEKIIYIEQGNKNKFDKSFDINELTSYFLDIQKSKLNSLFMRNLWKLKDSEDLDSYTKFLYELKEIGIDKDKKLVKMWCCFCNLMIYGIDDNTEKKYFYFKLTIYSILMLLDKNISYTNKFITAVMSYENINEENLYFVWNQFKRMSLKHMVIVDEKNDKLLNEMYDKCYMGLANDLKRHLVKIPSKERNKNLILILTIQFLDTTHAPTRTVLERAKALTKLGKKVMIVNTCEQYIMRGHLPMYQAEYGRVLEDYNNINTVKVDGFDIQFLQLREGYPLQYNIQILFNLIRELKPYYILSVGTGSMLADLSGNIVPCVSMALAFSTLPKTKNKMKILGRKLDSEEKKSLANSDIDIIESKFTFELKNQEKKFTRQELALPEDKFVLVVVGIRLQYEISHTFLEMLEKVCKNGCYVVFAGIMNNYNDIIKDYKAVVQNSSFIGYCDDILALMEICDLYVNPDRLGGGFSVIEALSKGVPGVYLNKGDVYVAGGEDFAVSNFDEMEKQIIKYKEDKEYYTNMAKLAKKRAELMTSSDGAILDIDRQICQRIEEKYW